MPVTATPVGARITETAMTESRTVSGVRPSACVCTDISSVIGHVVMRSCDGMAGVSVRVNMSARIAAKAGVGREMRTAACKVCRGGEMCAPTKMAAAEMSATAATMTSTAMGLSETG